MLSVMALSCGYGQAQSVDKDAALSLASQFFASHNSGASHRAPAQVAPVLSYTATTEGMPDFYVFNRGAETPGFVIINADASSESPVLGYAEDSSFDYQLLPDNMKWWLMQYQRNGVAKISAKVGNVLQDVEPLIKTKWGQNAPFNNNLFPVEGGNYGFVTGCTATAMAQIMKFYEYPTHGYGSRYNEVLYNNGTLALHFAADFAHTTYDWANMLEDYSSGCTPQQEQAVATLMHHAGVAENITYLSATNGGSQADDRQSAIALVEHFGYDRGMKRAVHKYMDDDDWFKIIYEELVANRPVMYSAQDGEDLSTSNGHTFICDGYRASDDCVHINWGWDGHFDGYFKLVGDDALKPNGTGTGGGSENSQYKYHQTLNYNIAPRSTNKECMQIGEYEEYFMLDGTKILENTTVDRSQAERNIALFLSPYNYGVNTAAFYYGVMLRNTTTKEATIVDGGYFELASGFYSIVDLKNLNKSLHVNISSTSFPADGTYELLPVYRDYYDASDPWHTFDLDLSQVIPHVIVKNSALAPVIDVEPQLTITNVSPLGDDGLVIDPVTQLTATLDYKNLTGYVLQNVPIYWKLRADNIEYGAGRSFPSISINGTGSTTFNFYNEEAKFTQGKLYTISFASDSSFKHPLNMPSISFYYTDPDVSVGEVTKSIRELRGGRASLELVNSLVKKALKK